MKTQLCLFPLLGIYLFLISAACIERKENQMPVQNQVVAEMPIAANQVTTYRLNFFQRLMLKLFVKKEKQVDESKADKLAVTSLFLGIGAWALFLSALAAPVLAVVSIPLAIGAMITGSSAIRQGTSKAGKAKTGKGLGLGALITIAVLTIIGAIFIAGGGLDWN